MKKIILVIIGVLISVYLITAECTVTFDRAGNYSPSETISAEMSCSEATEKSKDYTLTWMNCTGVGGGTLETDTGTTPSTAGENFYDGYDIPTNYSGCINASLSGTNLEGNDTAYVSGANTDALLISSASFGGGLLGKVGSIQATVKDEDGKLISGGQCKVSGWSNDETQMLLYQDTQMLNGEVKVSDIMPPTRFEEATQYAFKIICMCGSDGGAYECIDEDGSSVQDSSGITKGSFTTSQWLNVNTVTDKSLYYMKDEIFVCANVTNVNGTKRIPMNIYHQVRCSADSDINSDVDRVLIAGDGDNPDERGISVNTTQMQCKRFIIPEPRYLQGRSSECYASTTTWVLDDNREEIISYATTSPIFNLSSDELNLLPDWERNSTYVFISTINLSTNSFAGYNGSGTGNIDIKLLKPQSDVAPTYQTEVKEISLFGLLQTVNIKNVTATNLTGDSINAYLELLEDGSIEIELRDVDITPNGYYQIVLELNSFEERQAEALEGINSSAGTFDFSINAPDTTETTITVSGSGLTGDGRTLNRDLNIKCQVDGYPSTLKTFPVYCTDTFSFTQTMDVPPTNGIYTMRCTAVDRFFGEDAVQATDNFQKSTSAAESGGGGLTSASEAAAESAAKLKASKIELGDSMLWIGLLVLIGILLYGRKKREEERRNYNEIFKT